MDELNRGRLPDDFLAELTERPPGSRKVAKITEKKDSKSDKNDKGSLQDEGKKV